MNKTRYRLLIKPSKAILKITLMFTLANKFRAVSKKELFKVSLLFTPKFEQTSTQPKAIQ